jgi:PGF-pre-PGF domain-containing protein
MPTPVVQPSGSGVVLPPLNIFIVTDNGTAIVTPLTSISINGKYSIEDGNVERLIKQLNIPTLATNNSVSRKDLPEMTIVLPTYHINIEPSSVMPASDGMLTPKIAEIPAGTSVLVPIDLANTSGIAQGDAVRWIKMEYTPKVNTTNFALLVSALDNNPPNGAETPQADLKPLYLNVRWAGDFPRAQDPGVIDYYENPPKLTFAVTDEWANQQNVQRDSNGVPLVSLELLDETTGKWRQVNSIDSPTGGNDDGQYVYTAHLEHFSNYVITANKTKSTPSSSGNIPSTRSLDIFCHDSIGINDEVVKRTTTSFGEPPTKIRKVSVPIADTLLVSTKSLAYLKTLDIGQNMTVSVRLEDVSQRSILPPLVIATGIVEVENRGTMQNQIRIDIWYTDESGQKVSRSLNMSVGPQAISTGKFEIPFTSPGKPELFVEIKSIPSGNAIGHTILKVEVSWISIYLYALLIVAGSIIGISILIVVLTLTKRRRKR